MPFKVELNVKEFPKGEEFDVYGLLVPNGGFVELSAEAEQSFLSKHGGSPKEVLTNNPSVKVSGSSALKKEGGDS